MSAQPWLISPSNSSGAPSELRALEAALEAAAPARSSSWASPGSARRGCSRSWRRCADERGCLVLSGSASELERDLPFWVFVDALDEYVRGLPPARRWHRSAPSSTRGPEPERPPAAGRRAPPRAPGRPRAARRCWRAPAAGADARRPALGRPGLARAARRAAAPPAAGARAAGAGGAARGRCRSSCCRRSSARTARGTLTRLELTALSRDGRPRAARRRRRDGLRGERRQPVLPAAARPRARRAPARCRAT